MSRSSVSAQPGEDHGIPKAGNLGRFQYTGQAWLPELGVYYYKARIYSPTLGRFLQTDPIGHDDQINLYSYVGNDPLNKIDPMGTETGSVAYNSVVSLTEAAKENPPPDWAYQAAKYVPLTGPALRLMELILVPPQPGTPPVPGRAPKIKAPCCFVAGTLVDTESGLKPIEKIGVGDLVWSRNSETGETALKPVTAIVPRHDREIWTVRLTGDDNASELFETTEEHPWWVVGKGWVETTSLKPGMVLTTREGQTLVVTSAESARRVDGTYNLSVGGFETYFVGERRVFVHNCPSVYVVPGDRTPSGKPYVGRHKGDDVAKRGSRDGRQRQTEDKVEHVEGDTQTQRQAEQRWIDKMGGVDNLDNKRNEIAKPPTPK